MVCSTKALQRKLKSGSYSFADVLGFVGYSKSTRSLIEALNDPSERVRTASARSLGKIGDSESIAPLMESLKDGSSKVRDWAAWSLGWLGDPIAIDSLMKLMDDEEQ